MRCEYCGWNSNEKWREKICISHQRIIPNHHQYSESVFSFRPEHELGVEFFGWRSKRNRNIVHVSITPGARVPLEEGAGQVGLVTTKGHLIPTAGGVGIEKWDGHVREQRVVPPFRKVWRTPNHRSSRSDHPREEDEKGKCRRVSHSYWRMMEPQTQWLQHMFYEQRLIWCL